MSTFKLLLLALTLLGSVRTYAKNHGKLIEEHSSKLCSPLNHWQIVGVCQLSGNLWIFLETTNDPFYFVVQFTSEAVYETTVDWQKVHRIERLQKMWPVGESIRSDGNRLRGVFSLHGTQYDRQRLVGKRHSNSKSKSTPGAIVFVYASGSAIYDMASRSLFPLEDKSLFAESTAMPMINSNGHGGLLFLDGHWRYQTVEFENKAMWLTSRAYLVAEGPTMNENSWDPGKERTLLFAAGPQFEAQLTKGGSFRAVSWNWAHSYLDEQDIVHVFTNHSVYLFRRPLELQSEEPFPTEHLVTVRSLRLNYKDYFVCQKRTPAVIWSTFFALMLHMDPSNEPSLNSATRYTVLYVLFSLLFGATCLILLVFLWFKTPALTGSKLNSRARKSRKKRSSKSPTKSSSSSDASHEKYRSLSLKLKALKIYIPKRKNLQGHSKTTLRDSSLTKTTMKLQR